MKTSRTAPRAAKPSPAATPGRGRAGASPERRLAVVAGAGLPDEMPSAEAKDRISELVKKAAGGGRTTILSRGYGIAIIGPPEDIPEGERESATRLPTTEIKSGQTSLKGIVARSDYALLTIHGEVRAAVYRPQMHRAPGPEGSKLERLIALLEQTQSVEQRNAEARATAARLESLLAELHAEIKAGLDLLDTIDRTRATALRRRYGRLPPALHGERANS